MRVSYRWLQELIPRLDREPSEIAETLSTIGLAVDAVFDHERALRSLILAEVVRFEPHPAREKLRLVTVRTGATPPPLSSLSRPPQSTRIPTSTEVTIVCGASNVPPPGDLVVLAGIGVKLPGMDVVLSRREIGGVVSEGMLVSEAELGLAAESEGILTFKAGSFPPGTRLIDAIPETRDVVFEVDVTPNRPDALGHVGVARDLAAYFELDFAPPEGAELKASGPPITAKMAAENHVPARCPRYGLGLVTGVVVAPSPDFIRYRLYRLGVRPISNIVDMTNWLMLEWGQPLHAFDGSTIESGKIVVRMAQDGETMRTLDGAVRELVSDDLLICDGEKPAALAGIMGGADTEIRATTQSVLIECAYFDPRGIRRTARRLGIHSDSSHRFERGTDHGNTDRVLSRALALVAQFAGGQIASGTIRADGISPEIPAIELRSERMNRLLGIDVPFREATQLLGRLGLAVEFVSDVGRSGTVARIRGASHRPDVTLEADLIEEVARIRGLESIPTELPSIPPQSPRRGDAFERRVKNTACELGLSEALTYSFVSSSDLAALSAPKPTVVLKNPLTEERSVLRTSLLPGLLEALRRARRRGEGRVRLFAVGAIFLSVDTPHASSPARPRRAEDEGVLPYEQPTFAAILAGPRDEYLTSTPGEVDLYSAKAIAIEMVERLTGQTPSIAHAAGAGVQHLHPRGAALVLLAGELVGTFGPLHPDVLESFDLGGPAYAIELDLALIEQRGLRLPRYAPLPKLPPVLRDLSLVVSDATPAESVALAIRRAAGELCESVLIASEFRGGSVPTAHRSLTFRLTYRDPLSRTGGEGRTLTDKEVEEIQVRVLKEAETQFGAALRGDAR